MGRPQPPCSSRRTFPLKPGGGGGPPTSSPPLPPPLSFPVANRGRICVHTPWSRLLLGGQGRGTDEGRRKGSCLHFVPPLILKCVVGWLVTDGCTRIKVRKVATARKVPRVPTHSFQWTQVDAEPLRPRHSGRRPGEAGQTHGVCPPAVDGFRGQTGNRTK